MTGDTREGPTVKVETKISCSGCKHLTTQTSYGSNDYESVDFACDATKLSSGNPRCLPMSCDQTPGWCPFWPADQPKPTATQLQ